MKRIVGKTQSVEIDVDIDYECPKCHGDLYCMTCKAEETDPEETPWRPGQLIGLKQYQQEQEARKQKLASEVS